MLLGEETGAETDFGAEADSGAVTRGQWANSCPTGCKVGVCPGYQQPCSTVSSQSTAVPSQCDYQGKHQSLKGKIDMDTSHFYKLALFSKIKQVFPARSDLLNVIYFL